MNISGFLAEIFLIAKADAHAKANEKKQNKKHLEKKQKNDPQPRKP